MKRQALFLNRMRSCVTSRRALRGLLSGNGRDDCIRMTGGPLTLILLPLTIPGVT